ncbi:MAG TPA: cobalamin-binding protein [Candidatus Acidoferrales bacterium]|nr:cobalamin-binding protein [Candidatus Acidoferrales bacterium]
MRIASLLPSATEILFALGLGDCVIGITHECDFPPEAAAKPALMRPRVDPLASPTELDRQVRALVERGESLYEIDDERLCSLAPDLIITQDLCHVCAASPGDLASALSRISVQPRVLTLQPKMLTDVWADIRRIGEVTGRVNEANNLAESLARRVALIAHSVADATSRPLVFCLEWLDPFYVGGHWVPEMVALAGGQDLSGQVGKPSFRVTSEEILAAQPEIIVVMPCGYNLARTREEYRRAIFPEGWKDLPAVRSGRVFAVDANSYFSRSGPRLADGVAILAHMFHPECTNTGIPAGAFSGIQCS